MRFTQNFFLVWLPPDQSWWRKQRLPRSSWRVGRRFQRQWWDQANLRWWSESSQQSSSSEYNCVPQTQTRITWSPLCTIYHWEQTEMDSSPVSFAIIDPFGRNPVLHSQNPSRKYRHYSAESTAGTHSSGSPCNPWQWVLFLGELSL